MENIFKMNCCISFIGLCGSSDLISSLALPNVMSLKKKNRHYIYHTKTKYYTCTVHYVVLKVKILKNQRS